jgi:hypothetical protein
MTGLFVGEDGAFWPHAYALPLQALRRGVGDFGMSQARLDIPRYVLLNGIQILYNGIRKRRVWW